MGSESNSRISQFDGPPQGSLFDRVIEAAYQRYGTETAQMVYEELALSTASIKLKQEFGTKRKKVPMFRHPLIFGETESFKSQMVADFRTHFLPGEISNSQIDSSTPRALIGSIDPDDGTVYAPELTTKDLVQVEWDTLATMANYDQVAGVFYKALEEGELRNDMVSTAKADTDQPEVEEYMKEWGIEKDNFKLTFPVNALMIGVVHLESSFWEKFDSAFYNRWFPIYVDQPEGYIGKARKIRIYWMQISPRSNVASGIFSIEFLWETNSLA